MDPQLNTTNNPQIDDSQSPLPPQQKSSKKRRKSILFVFLLFLVLIIIFLSFGDQDKKPVENWSDNIISPENTISKELDSVKNYNTSQVSFIEKRRSRTNPTNYNFVNVNANVESIKQRKIPDNQISYIILNNMVLLRSTLEALEASGWAYSNEYGASADISYRDLNLSPMQLEEIIEVEKKKAIERELPAELEYLYTSSQAEQELESLIHEAYGEYFTYLRSKGVHQVYLSEMEKIVPNTNDRIYYKNDPTIPSSSFGQMDSQGYVSDYSKRVIEITSGSLFNNTKFLYNSRVLGEVPEDPIELDNYYKELRNMALRISVYHEATHVLQRAYMTAHAPESARKDQHIYIDAKSTLLDLDVQNKWQWSKYPQDKEFEELERTQESQADGIAFEVVTNVYDMSFEQRDALWSHFFGRLDPTWEVIQDIKYLYESNWPDMTNKSELGSSLDDVLFDSFPASLEDRIILKRTLRASSSLAKDAGYNDPIRPEETAKFWEGTSSF